jgi:hypothetical protein
LGDAAEHIAEEVLLGVHRGGAPVVAVEHLQQKQQPVRNLELTPRAERVHAAAGRADRRTRRRWVECG